MKTRYSFPLAAVLLIASLPSFATVFRPTTDRQLASRADAVVIGTVRDSAPRLRADGYVVTEAHVSVEETLKGSASGVITVVEFGGMVDGHVTFIADSATYAEGERVMAFLRQRTDGTWLTTSMTLGKFVLRDGLAIRESEELGVSAHPAGAFAQFVRDVAIGVPTGETAEAATIPAPDTVGRRVAADALRITPNGNAKNYALLASGMPVRWPGCTPLNCTAGTATVSVIFKRTAADPGGIAAGRAAWTNDPNSTITMTDGGLSASSAPASFVDPGTNENVIYLNYTGAFSGTGYQCDGAQACTIGTGGYTHTFDGDTWVSIGDADIIVAPGVSSSGSFPSIITHELGHAIGLRHSDQGTPSAFVAIMDSTINPSLGTTLQQWDEDAVDSLYGNGPVCAQPQVVGSSRVDLQACKLEYSIVSPK